MRVTAVVLVAQDWLPDDLEGHKTSSFGYRQYVFKRERTRDLLRALPPMIARCVSEADGQDRRTDEVHVYPIAYHPWARNAATFHIDLDTGEGSKPGRLEQSRRQLLIGLHFDAALTAYFSQITEEWLKRSKVAMPTWDCRVGAAGVNFPMPR